MATCKRKRRNAEKRRTKVAQAFAQMLRANTSQNAYEGSRYLGGIGFISDVWINEELVIGMTIETDEDGSKDLLLCLTPSVAIKP